MSFTSVIQTYDKNVHLGWEGRFRSLPGVFTGQYHFKLHERKSGTIFEQSEDFSGLLAMVLHWVGSDMYRNTESGFKLMTRHQRIGWKAYQPRIMYQEREWRYVQWGNDWWKIAMTTGILQGV